MVLAEAQFCLGLLERSWEIWEITKALAKGVVELRIKVGPGYRMYIGLHEDTVIVLLSGGDKASQAKDIQRAHEFLEGVETIMRKLRKFENYLDEVLVDPKEAANYLNAASKEGEEVFLAALQNVARARGMTALAKKPDYNARVSTRCFRKGEIRDTDRCVRLLTSSAFAWNFVQRRPRDRVLDGGQLLEEIRISWSWSGP